MGFDMKNNLSNQFNDDFYPINKVKFNYSVKYKAYYDALMVLVPFRYKFVFVIIKVLIVFFLGILVYFSITTVWFMSIVTLMLTFVLIYLHSKTKKLMIYEVIKKRNMSKADWFQDAIKEGFIKFIE